MFYCPGCEPEYVGNAGYSSAFCEEHRPPDPPPGVVVRRYSRDDIEGIKTRVEKARLAGWRDRDLARRLGVSERTVNRWRQGQVLPDSPRILAMALDVLLTQEIPPRG